MNRRDALTSLFTLPMAASTIERKEPTEIQAAILPARKPQIGWTDFTKGKGPQLRNVEDL